MNDQEWYTPEWIFQKLDTHFDLDVCAPKIQIPYIPADKHYCIDDDGLNQAWTGKVWCNPPFRNAGQWMQKFHQHGNGIALCPISKTLWFDRLVQDPNVRIEILPSTLKFIHNGIPSPVRTSCCLVYMGDDI